jgi:FkbM family methyltransferase
MAASEKSGNRRNKLRERLAYLARHPSHAFYHPHQRLWNLYLTPVAKRLLLKQPLILADTLLLWAEVAIGRIGAKIAPGTREGQILIFDVGQHVDPKQIIALQRWFGDSHDLRVHAFEAHPDYCEAARQKLSAFPNVTLENLALVGPDFAGEEVRLYLAGGRGVGDSIFARRSDDFISVPALRLSDYIKRNGIDLTSHVTILRMNIEGAEFGVLQDLAESGVLDQIDGFFGSWDDMYKNDPTCDEAFRAFLCKHRIRSIPFNDRDLGGGAVLGLRARAIRFALATVMSRGKRSR